MFDFKCPSRTSTQREGLVPLPVLPLWFSPKLLGLCRPLLHALGGQSLKVGFKFLYPFPGGEKKTSVFS